MSAPTLSGPGVVLRPLQRSDAPALFVTHGDADVQRYRKQAPHKSVADTERYIEDTLARGLGWAITESGGDALGRIALRTLRDGVGEIGIAIRRDAQRLGLGARALALVEDYAFATLGMHRLSADIDSENQASLALFQRVGFQREALLRAAARTHIGLRDSIIMGKLAAQ